MEIEKNAVFITVPCAIFCERPQNFLDFDLKITAPFDTKLATTVEGVFGSSVCVLDDKGKKIDISGISGKTEWIYIKKPDFLHKQSFSFLDVVDILKALRGEGGCAWDRAQTHESIRSNLIEEAYELVDAIDLKDKAKIVEETGDLLLQAVFHMTIASEEKEFEFKDVYGELCKKLITRHTHIFGNDKAENSEAALASWEKNKLREKSITSVAQNMREVPQGMPSLLRAYKTAKRAAKGGFVETDYDAAIQSVRGGLDKLMQAYDNGKDTETITGKTLFALVNLLRIIGAEPEVALNKFIGDFVSDVDAEENRRDANKTGSVK